MAPQWFSLKLDVPADMATNDLERSEVIKSVLELMEVGDYAPLLDRQDLSSEDWRRVVLECIEFEDGRGWRAHAHDDLTIAEDRKRTRANELCDNIGAVSS